MEKFFKPSTSAKGRKELSLAKEQFVKHKLKVVAKPIPAVAKLTQELSADELEKVLRHLRLEVIFKIVLNNFISF